MKRKLLAVVFVMLFAGAWGCPPPATKSIKWDSGHESFRGGYTVLYTAVNDTLTSLIFLNAGASKFSSAGFARKAHGVYDVSCNVGGNAVKITSYVDTGEMDIDGKVYQITQGSVFLCEVTGGGVQVTQIVRDITQGYAEFYFPHDEVNKLIEDNAAAREFAMKCAPAEERPK